MKSSVKVIDTSGRKNIAFEVDEDFRKAYFEAHGVPLSDNIKFVPKRDDQGRQIQVKVDTEIEYAGAHLFHTIRRVKRWYKNQANTGKRVPRHIYLGLQAFRLADEKGYKQFSSEVSITT